MGRFGTYNRDGFTGLDYADQRFYASSYGRYNTPDPEYGGEIANPVSMNLYNYTIGDPVNLNDPSGLAPTCGGSEYFFNGKDQGTIANAISQNSSVGLLATAMYTESGHGSNSNVTYEEWAIGAVILNRWELVNKDWYWFNGPAAPGSKPISVSGWGTPGDSLESIIKNPSQFAIYARQPDGTIALSASAQRNLDSALNSASGSSLCGDLAWALTVSNGMWGERNDRHPLYLLDDFVLTGFNSFSPAHASSSYESRVASFGDANVFYGAPETTFGTSVPPSSPSRSRAPGKIPIPSPPRPPKAPGGLPQ